MIRVCLIKLNFLGVILQLSSLSVHAEDMFGELFNEANAFYSRANNLQGRIDKLSEKVTRLDSTVEEGVYIIFNSFVKSYLNRPKH